MNNKKQSDGHVDDITLRDYLAAKALPVVFSSGWFAIANKEAIANESYAMADAMMQARKRK
jgi:hypothetical protein